MNILAKTAAAFLLVAPLAAGAQSRTAIAISGGPSVPLGSFRDTQNQGVEFGIGYIRGSDESPLGVRIDLGYDRLPGKTVGGVKNPDRKVVGGTANLLFSLSGYRLKPYILGGAGAFKMTSSGASAPKTRFGFDFGLGFTIPIGSKAVFVESRVNSISQHNAKPLRFVPVVLGFLF